MGIDRESVARPWISIDKTKELLKKLEENNIANIGETEHKNKPQLLFNDDVGSLRTEELYFDKNSNEINFSGMAQTIEGEFYVGLNIPISDIVLVDILEHAIKKLSKLKTALESLK